MKKKLIFNFVSSATKRLSLDVDYACRQLIVHLSIKKQIGRVIKEDVFDLKTN